MLELGFTCFGMRRIFGRLEPRNPASARVLERLGMRREAHLVENEWLRGEWQSEAIYALLAREWRQQPAAPAEVGDHPAQQQDHQADDRPRTPCATPRRGRRRSCPRSRRSSVSGSTITEIAVSTRKVSLVRCAIWDSFVDSRPSTTSL